jgi:hypothetical protein
MARNVRLNKRFFEQREKLCQQHAYESRLASAIESGRVYGLRQQKLGILNKIHLNKQWAKPPVVDPW